MDSTSSDALGDAMRQRVRALMATRPDIDKREFGRAVWKGPSWVSEFLTGTRTTNDLRLLLRMAKLFRVSPMYLLDMEGGADRVAEEASLLGAWRSMTPEEQSLLLDVATKLVRIRDAARDVPAPLDPLNATE